MTNEEIQQIALGNGFKLKEQPDGTMALNPYVFDFARTLISEAAWRELAMKGRAALAAAPTPPRVEAIAELTGHWHDGFAYVRILTKTKGLLPLGTKLYTHPANDGLRKAAEELIGWWDTPEKHDVGCYPGVREKFEELRTELKKTKS